jgi:hypothetical protein
MQVDGGDRGCWQHHIAPRDVDPERTISQNMDPIPEERTGPTINIRNTTPMSNMKSIIVGPSAAREPLISVIPSLLKEKVTNIIYISSPSAPFRFIELLIIDHSTLILDYFNDSHLLIHLAFALYPQFGDHALKKIVLDYLDTEEGTDEIESDPKMIVANKCS